MALVDLQRSVQELCLRAQVPAEARRALGDGWLVYRELVRARMHEEIELGLSRTCRAAGPALIARAIEHYLEHTPPRTRLFRELACDFARALSEYLPREPSAPAYLGDLALFEAAVWEVADLDARVAVRVTELAFDAPPVLSPALRILQLSHAVHERPAPDGGYAAGPCWLAVHRPADDQRVQPWRINQLTYDLLSCWQRGTLTVTQATQQVAAAHGVRVDAKFVDGLCGVLADFIEKGIILGSRVSD